MSASHRMISLAMAIALSGCATTSTIKLYPGPEKNPSQIATLYLDPHVAVTQVDGVSEHPTDKGRVLAHSAEKRREVIAVEPGPHVLRARFFVLCLQSEGEFPLQFTAEPGKRYRLKSNVDAEGKRWVPEIVEYGGEEVEDTFPWLKALCPANIQVVWLRR